MSKEVILLLGSGGRESALDECLGAKSGALVYVGPGNGGIPARRRLPKLDLGNFSEILVAARMVQATMIVVGPEQPLVDGLGDYMTEMAPDIKFFGPSKFGAELEGSKIFTKTRCVQWNVSTAAFDFAGDYKVAERIIKDTGYHVIKADGLCAGKGVVVAEDEKEALNAAKEMLVHKIYKQAGEKIVMEEKMVGPECSLMALTDGHKVVPLLPARDYKRALVGNKGLNTGGMGAYAPLPDVSNDQLWKMVDDILIPTVNGMSKRGTPYKGLLYAGIMITKDGPKLVEYNCRFGDPETQVVLPLLDCDLVPYLIACTNGTLSHMPSLKWKECYALGVTMTATGYPGTYPKGDVITGIEMARKLPNVRVYEAGTEVDAQGNKLTNGGRVLNVVGLGRDLHNAQSNSYKGVSEIYWPNETHRPDIGD